MDKVYFVSIMYVDDVICMCEIEAINIDTIFNASKSMTLRIAADHHIACAVVQVGGKYIQFVEKARYLGVYLCVDESCASFYKSINGLLYKSKCFENEPVLLELIDCFCKLYSLYAFVDIELLNLFM